MTMYHSYSSASDYSTPSCMKKRCKSTEPESHQTAKIIIIIIIFTLVLHKAVALYTDRCTSPSLFNNFEVLEEVWLNFRRHFLHLYACAPVWLGHK